jgi:hypothetical protein
MLTGEAVEPSFGPRGHPDVTGFRGRRMADSVQCVRQKTTR